MHSFKVVKIIIRTDVPGKKSARLQIGELEE